MLNKNATQDELTISLQPHGDDVSKNKLNNKTDTYTVDEAITAIGVGPFQYKILIVTGLFWAADAIELMRLTFLLPILKKEWNLDSGVDGTIGAVVFFGILFGNVFWSNFSDRFGRKKAVIISNIGQLIFGTLSAFSWDIYSMMISRFLTGFHLGASSCAYTLYAEFAPKEIRGKMLVLQQSFWAAGCFVNALIAWITLELLNWRYYIIISNTPLVVILILGWFLPESARWYAINGNIDKAQDILDKAAKENNGTNEPIDEIILDVDQSIIDKKGNICEIFEYEYYKTTLLLFNIIFLVTFGYYGISFLSENFFNDITGSNDDTYWQIVVTTSSELPGIVIAMFTLDRYGRKNCLIVNFFIFSIAMFCLMSKEIQNKIGLSVTLIFFGRMCASIQFLCIYVFFSEYYPTQIRNTALGLGAAIAKVAGMITTYISQSDNIIYSFYLYGLCGAIGVVCGLMLGKDTYGNDLTSKSTLLSKQIGKNKIANNQSKIIK